MKPLEAAVGQPLERLQVLVGVVADVQQGDALLGEVGSGDEQVLRGERHVLRAVVRGRRLPRGAATARWCPSSLSIRESTGRVRA